jgi:hypothetical protein
MISANTVTVKTKYHNNILKMVTFEFLRTRYPNKYKDGWFCEGKKMTGCRGAGGNADMESVLYHCSECSYDHCQGCFDFYGKEPH